MTTTAWIHTYSGRAFDFVEPDPASVSLKDMVHALSHINRFTGHTQNPYNVAHHSVLVSEHVPRESALIALLHDVHEAYVGDVSSPLKQLLPGFRVIEKRIMGVVREALGVPVIEPPEVKLADLRMCLTEARDLLAPCSRAWSPVFADMEPYECVTLCYPWTPEIARKNFISVYDALVAGEEPPRFCNCERIS